MDDNNTERSSADDFQRKNGSTMDTNERIDEERVMRWMGLVIADSYGNGMDDREAAQAFRQMIAHLEAHIDTADAVQAT